MKTRSAAFSAFTQEPGPVSEDPHSLPPMNFSLSPVVGHLKGSR